MGNLAETIGQTILLAGHYGSGKTNIALNLAVSLRQAGRTVTVIDLDIINPYFRLADGIDILERFGIDNVAPTYANTNVDIPALSPRVAGLLEDSGDTLIVDVGGDDTGAAALGGFAQTLTRRGYEMLLVVNPFRPFTETAADAAGVAADIELAARLKFTGIAANPNLGRETTVETICGAKPFFDGLSERLHLPVCMTAVRKDLVSAVSGAVSGPVLPLEILQKPGWDIF